MIKTDDGILLTPQEYFELKLKEVTLELLEAAGVDNWDGCEEAFEDLYEIEAKLRKEILSD